MSEKPLHDLALEQVALGERKAAADPQALEALARSNEEILRAYPAERMAAQIQRRAEGGAGLGGAGLRARRSRLLVISLASAFAVTVVGVVSLLPLINEPTERTKGLAPHLLAWRRTQSEPEAITAGTLVKKGDIVQLAYVGVGARYGVIASLDGRGQTTLHFPAEVQQSTRLAGDSGAVLLEDSYELDDAPLYERFFFVTSDDPLEAAAVMEAIHRLSEQRDGGRTGVPVVSGKTRVMSFLLPKEPS